MRATRVLEATLRRDRVVVLAGLAGVTGISWAYVVHLSGGMSGMGTSMSLMRPWGAMELALAFAMWTAMMTAMMVPTVAPVVTMFATINAAQRQQGRPYVPTSVFLTGYCAVWTAVAAVATGAQWALHEASASTSTGGVTPVLGGAVLVGAGAFQFSSVKHRCLVRCRTPFAFLMSEWRAGTRGAVVMGARHGVVCLGCCWALMAVMFVVGTMNLVWMAAIGAYVLVEKVAPAGERLARVAGAGLVAWGVSTVFVT